MQGSLSLKSVIFLLFYTLIIKLIKYLLLSGLLVKSMKPSDSDCHNSPVSMQQLGRKFLMCQQVHASGICHKRINTVCSLFFLLFLLYAPSLTHPIIVLYDIVWLLLGYIPEHFICLDMSSDLLIQLLLISINDYINEKYNSIVTIILIWELHNYGNRSFQNQRQNCFTISKLFAISTTVNSMKFKSMKFSDKTNHIFVYDFSPLEKLKEHRNIILEKRYRDKTICITLLESR